LQDLRCIIIFDTEHEGKPKRVRGRHKVTCEACNAYGTLIECDTCTSSWHSHCVSVDPVPDPDSPPDYWSCPKCLEKRSQAVNGLQKDSMRSSTTQSDEIDSWRMQGIDGDVRSLGAVTGFQEVQQCCLKLSATIQVLQEALSANSSQLKGLELEAHRMCTEFAEVKKERDWVAAGLLDVTRELDLIKAENSESTSRMDGIMKIVEGSFVHRRHV
jgi:hypothetical protein